MSWDWRYRYVDPDGMVHVEACRDGTAFWRTVTSCQKPVPFGEAWEDDRSLIVTCVICATKLVG